MAIPSKLRSTVAKCIRQLLSDREGVIIATVSALKQLIDIHELAKHIESPSKEEMEKIFEEGRAQGLEDAERRQIEAINTLPAVVEVSWDEIARFLLQHKHRLHQDHHNFIDDMAERADDDNEPSERQQEYMRNLYRRLLRQRRR
jgi:hypothetical protein